jgi:hypothetical protein
MEHKAEFEKYNCRIVLVRFGSKDYAGRFLKDVGHDFDMIIDEERQFYKYFRLNKVLNMIWQTNTMIRYAARMLAEENAPNPFFDRTDDPHQNVSFF